jgi:hypothetical protein
MPSHTAYELVLAAFGANLPFGAYRSTVRRLGWRWLLAIHVPIPAIFLLRTGAGYSYWFIPWLAAGAICGQLAGARLLKLWHARRDERPSDPSLAAAATLLADTEVQAGPQDYQAVDVREAVPPGSD